MSEQRGGIGPDTDGPDVQDAGTGPHGATTGPVMPVALDEGAVLPGRAHEDDAGFDLTAAEAVHIPAGGRALVGTGVSIALPQGTVGLVCPRSGLAVRHGLTVLNGPGIIDAGYRGEVRVPLHNTDLEAGIDLAPGDRIAQLVVVPFLAPTLEVVPDATHLTSSTRQNDGFGSSGGLSGRTGAVPSEVAAHDGKE